MRKLQKKPLQTNNGAMNEGHVPENKRRQTWFIPIIDAMTSSINTSGIKHSFDSKFKKKFLMMQPRPYAYHFSLVGKLLTCLKAYLMSYERLSNVQYNCG